jgi:hypothetical protein
MATADRVDILVSFIKWSGLRLLQPAFERLRDSGVSVRILSTSYMGASDPAALEWLAKQNNISVRISYDTGGTRMHAKAYHFVVSLPRFDCLKPWKKSYFAHFTTLVSLIMSIWMMSVSGGMGATIVVS